VTREEWLLKRTFAAAPVDPGEVADLKERSGVSVSVVLPTLNVADTVGPICAAIRDRWMAPGGLVDELVVVDSASRDATARLAAAHGARVVNETEILPQAGPGRGKGEALWKSLASTCGDIVVWIDSDIQDFDSDFVPRLVTPLLRDPAIQYVKGFYRRPLGASADDGGRVTEICARPLINRYVPDLAGFLQPLSGEAAGRRTALDHVPFFTGYAVELGLLIDLLATVGLEGLAQADLGERRHTNQPTPALGRMAYEITDAVLTRVNGGIHRAERPYARPIARGGGWVFERTDVRITERPPMASIPLADRRR
jgi:glucosyl-3-phosphoglycerate synthase